MFIFICSMGVLIRGVITITTNDENKTFAMLGELTKFALQSRQSENYYNDYSDPPPYPAYYYPRPHYYYPSVKPPYAPTESVMKILHSISNHDDLQCVPKIICEFTTGAITSRQNEINSPVNINAESLVSLLSAFSSLQSSPLLYFGKAALLGYTSKGNSRVCGTAYPECPADPDKLVQYLNKHNGGFFRYFNGMMPPKVHSYSDNYRPNYHHLKAQQRILNQPSAYLPLEEVADQKVTFPHDDEGEVDNYLRFPLNKNYFSLKKKARDLKFPDEAQENSPFRRPKEYSHFNAENDVLDIQKPFPNHKASPLIFPLRTGTGELRLDAEEYNKNTAYEDDDVRIVINGDFNFPSK